MIRRLIGDLCSDIADWFYEQALRLDPPETVAFSLAPFEPREYDWRREAQPVAEPWRDLAGGHPAWRRYACADASCQFRCGEGEQERYTIHWNTHHREGRS